MNPRAKHEAGSILIAFTLFLALMLSFAAVATEGGRWYLVRAELSKSVDAGALQGARNISNPFVSPTTLAVDFCNENFQNGYLGTPGSGTGTANFTAQMVGTNKVLVNGSASAVAILGKIVGFNLIPVAAAGAAAMAKVEIMLILDRSGSMGTPDANGKLPINNLKTAAASFVDYFTDTQASDKMGLISFSTVPRLDRPLGTNFVSALKTAIAANNMNAGGNTNAEDAIDMANGPGGFTDQTGVPVDARVQQFAIFFSDGLPNTFRWTFKRNNTTYDAVARCNDNCDDPNNLRFDSGLYSASTGGPLILGGAVPTGDGLLAGSSKCGTISTRWNVFDIYPVPGYAADACSIPINPYMHNQVCTIARTLAILHAKELKDAGISVFTIGLGDGVDKPLMTALASSTDQALFAYASGDLQALFQKVAQDIKLRLVQ